MKICEMYRLSCGPISSATFLIFRFVLFYDTTFNLEHLDNYSDIKVLLPKIKYTNGTGNTKDITAKKFWLI